jgi:hypothetical protein
MTIWVTTWFFNIVDLYCSYRCIPRKGVLRLPHTQQHNMYVSIYDVVYTFINKPGMYIVSYKI